MRECILCRHLAPIATPDRLTATLCATDRLTARLCAKASADLVPHRKERRRGTARICEKNSATCPEKSQGAEDTPAESRVSPSESRAGCPRLGARGAAPTGPPHWARGAPREVEEWRAAAHRPRRTRQGEKPRWTDGAPLRGRRSHSPAWRSRLTTASPKTRMSRFERSTLFE